jgi:predicted RNase H-like HicB family nuclease
LPRKSKRQRSCIQRGKAAASAQRKREEALRTLEEELHQEWRELKQAERNLIKY